MILKKIFCLFLASTSLLIAQNRGLADSTSSLFAGSANCNTCHTPGFGPDYALTDSAGNDLTPSRDWRSTMMANAARDPYWLAKVESEVNENPHLKEIIEDKCSTCHMPMGRTQAIADGADYFSIAEGFKNQLAMDGVSCTVCHQIQPDNLGQPSSFSGGYRIDSSRVIYGPYDSLDTFGAETMVSGVQYEPAHGPHMLSAELCATCHTLYTNYVDDDGQVAGVFPEQMPYFEWKASSYPANEITCQSCHVPKVKQDIVISWAPLGIAPQNPLFKHQFVGGNAFILTMLRDNGQAIGVTAESSHFDSTIAHTRRQLQNLTASLTLTAQQKGNILDVDVTIENLAGHKFPTGYPGRRAWLHLVVTNGAMDTLFESGTYNTDGTINHQVENYATHQDTIIDDSLTQIYEAVMADVNGEVTQVLLRAASYIKDNRLPPKGFSSSAERYEDIAIHGLAETDNNFNDSGDGRDNVTYRVDLTGQASTDLTIQAELLYQSVQPRDVDYFRAHETARVATFLDYYDNMVNIPELIQSKILNINVVNVHEDDLLNQPYVFHLDQNYPNPFNTGTVIPYTVGKVRAYQDKPLQVILNIYNMLGQRVATLVNKKQNAGQYIVQFNAKDLPSGIYMYSLQAGKQIRHKKMLLIK